MRLFAILLLLALAGPARADQPFRLAEHLPPWLHIAGETRWRIEGLANQFRPGGVGGDQAIAGRTLLLAEVCLGGRVTLGAEVQDSRLYIDDAGTPLSTAQVNPIELLQAYARIRLSGWLPGGYDGHVRLGRLTQDVDSRRFLARNGFRNTINGYTGVSLVLDGPARDRSHAFYLVPVERRPDTFAALAANDPVFDVEQGNLRYWGLFHRRPVGPIDIAGGLYGLHERDGADRPTRNRQLITPNLRLVRVPAPGDWDLDIDMALQFGSARATAAPTDRERLSVFAHFHHLEAGYTFRLPFRPRLALEIDIVSGDSDPADGEFGRFDTLFGSRRFDFAHTGISGPLSRGNVQTYGLRADVAEGRFDANLRLKAAQLDAAADVWVGSGGVRDISGQSGRFLGVLADGRMRYWLRPGNLRAEIGGTLLTEGRFRASAPNAPGQGLLAYGYLMLTAQF